MSQDKTTRPAERIMEGLREALSVVRGEANPARTMIPLPMVTRVEVIDHSPDGEGRAWTKRNLSNVLLSLQDDGRTLKVFVR